MDKLHGLQKERDAEKEEEEEEEENKINKCKVN